MKFQRLLGKSYESIRWKFRNRVPQNSLNFSSWIGDSDNWDKIGELFKNWHIYIYKTASGCIIDSRCSRKNKKGVGVGDRNSRGLFSVRRPNAKSLKTTPSMLHGQRTFLRQIRISWNRIIRRAVHADPFCGFVRENKNPRRKRRNVVTGGDHKRCIPTRFVINERTRAVH